MMCMFLKFTRSKAFNLCCLLFVVSSLSAQLPLDAVKVVDIKRDTLNLIQDTTAVHIIIFASNNCCLDCFRPFDNFSEETEILLNDSTLKVTVLVRSMMDTRARKMMINTLMKVMPKTLSLSNVYFDIYDEEYVFNETASSGVFGSYKVDKTPAILLYQPNSLPKYIDYTNSNNFLNNKRTWTLAELIAFE